MINKIKAFHGTSKIAVHRRFGGTVDFSGSGIPVAFDVSVLGRRAKA